MTQPDEPLSKKDDVQDDRQHQIIVDDPEDFAKTRQLRSIFDARDDYIDARREANHAWETNDIGMPRKNRHIFRYLQDLAMTVEPILKSYDAGREIWDEKTYSVDRRFCAKEDLPDIDSAIIILRDSVQQQSNAVDNMMTEQLLQEWDDLYDGEYPTRSKRRRMEAEIRSQAASWGWEVQGLGALIDQDHRLKYRVKNPSSELFNTTSVPSRVSDDAFRDIQGFIRQIGLGVQFETEQQTKIDDELLEEVDEWRRQNV